MKKIWILLLLLPVLLLCSCTSNESNSPTDNYMVPQDVATATTEGLSYDDLFLWPTVPTESKSSTAYTGSDYKEDWDRPEQILGAPVTCIAGDTAFTCYVPEYKELTDKGDVVYILTNQNMHVLLTSTAAGNPTEDLEHVFQNNVQWIMGQYEAHRGPLNKNYAIEIVDEQAETVNGKQMRYMRARMTYRNLKDDYTWKVLGYAAKLSTGEYAMMILGYYDHTDFLEMKDSLDNMSWSMEEVS